MFNNPFWTKLIVLIFSLTIHYLIIIFVKNKVNVVRITLLCQYYL